MASRAKTTTIDVNDLDQGNDRIEDPDENDRRQGHIANDHENAIEIENGIEMEGK